MAQCNFSIPFNGTQDEFFDRMKAKIEQGGGAISGNTAKADFSISTPIGSIKGFFGLTNGQCNIEVTQKPMLLSCSGIKDFIEKQV